MTNGVKDFRGKVDFAGIRVVDFERSDLNPLNGENSLFVANLSQFLKVHPFAHLIRKSPCSVIKYAYSVWSSSPGCQILLKIA